MLRLANQLGHPVYHHPLALQYDFGNIQNAAARNWRRQITSNHPALTEPPPIQQIIADTCGNPPQGNNDWVEHHLLAATVGNAVSSLVTQDDKIPKKAQRLGLGERVAYIEMQ